MIRRELDRIFSRFSGTSFAVTYWDGTESQFGKGLPRFSLRLRDRSACLRIILNPGEAFGDAFTAGQVEVDGDLEEFLRLVFDRNIHRSRSFSIKAVSRAACRFVLPNSKARSQKNVACHYDLGNEFYASWLGQEMVYSCAYFKCDSDDIDTAQSQKLEHICRKLQLRPGQTFLDIGCGWGGLLLYAASHFDVQAVGITLSAEQKAEAEQRVATAGLSNRVRIELCDYRQLGAERKFDRVASIGMLEHVGKRLIPLFMESLKQTLAPGGVALVQTIGSPLGTMPHLWIEKHIFPGIYLPCLGEVSVAASSRGLYVTDVESLRRHYALTMNRWSESFESVQEKVAAVYGGEFVRAWRLYLRGCAVAFHCGKLDLWQFCLSNGVNNFAPLTRSHIYNEEVGEVAMKP